ncbi:MAG: UDP-glucose 4-epimerase GalE [Lachnospiraceae bacterium]|nr:UDP-glucose 4-epimerase GalE [Lachnospiraceae bacterium]
MTILVTGGAGFIASHTNVELLQAGYDVVVMDNLCNSSKESVARVEQITGKKMRFYQADMRKMEELEPVFAENNIDVIIHFAGLKAVGESCEKPYEYYENNISGTLNIIAMMKKYNVKKMVFSSSATVYGNPEVVPITEECKVGGVTNPYGQTKLMLEQILTDIQKADPSFDIALLRYFNPIGAHESGLIGEAPNGIPNNLLPYVAKVAAGVLEKVNVFGDDYDTPDGTGVRDYIHVVDLAKGHVCAVKKLLEHPGLVVYNLGTGIGYSVLDIIHNFEKACGKKIPYVIAPRRAGDIATCYSDPSKAERELGWKAEYGIDRMCEDAWRWQSMNPNGYEPVEKG